jgi:hypothetical protein
MASRNKLSVREPELAGAPLPIPGKEIWQNIRRHANNGKLPSWEGLVDASLTKADGSQMRGRGQSARRDLVRFIALAGRTIGGVVSLPGLVPNYNSSNWDDLADLLATQMAENRWLLRNKGLDADDLKPLAEAIRIEKGRNSAALTTWSMHRRIQVIRSLVTHDESIVLFGDAGLTSIFLARAGFRNLTVVDRDLVGLSNIARLAQAEGLPIALKTESAHTPIRPSRHRLAICESHSNSQLKSDLKGALDSLSDRQESLIFVNFSALSMQRRGLASLEADLDDADLGVEAFFPSLNAYSLGHMSSPIMALLGRTIDLAPSGIRRALEASFFTSDGMLLRKRALH